MSDHDVRIFTCVYPVFTFKYNTVKIIRHYPQRLDNAKNWDLNLYQSALPSIHVCMIKEEFVILYTEFKWRIEVHFGQNAAKNNDLLKKCFE